VPFEEKPLPQPSKVSPFGRNDKPCEIFIAVGQGFSLRSQRQIIYMLRDVVLMITSGLAVKNKIKTSRSFKGTRRSFGYEVGFPDA
jgi:hypothetical protein